MNQDMILTPEQVAKLAVHCRKICAQIQVYKLVYTLVHLARHSSDMFGCTNCDEDDCQLCDLAAEISGIVLPDEVEDEE